LTKWPYCDIFYRYFEQYCSLTKRQLFCLFADKLNVSTAPFKTDKQERKGNMKLKAAIQVLGYYTAMVRFAPYMIPSPLELSFDDLVCFYDTIVCEVGRKGGIWRISAEQIEKFRDILAGIEKAMVTKAKCCGELVAVLQRVPPARPRKGDYGCILWQNRKKLLDDAMRRAATFKAWLYIHSLYLSEGTVKKKALQKMVEMACTFEEWAVVFARIVDSDREGRRMAFRKMQETGSLKNWIEYLSNDFLLCGYLSHGSKRSTIGESYRQKLAMISGELQRFGTLTQWHAVLKQATPNCALHTAAKVACLSPIIDR
jgi:hypothetical protein